MNTPNNPEKKSNAGGITKLDIKIYYIAIVIKSKWHWHYNRYVEQKMEISNSKMSAHNCSFLIFKKGGQKTHWRKTASLTKSSGKSEDT